MGAQSATYIITTALALDIAALTGPEGKSDGKSDIDPEDDPDGKAVRLRRLATPFRKRICIGMILDVRSSLPHDPLLCDCLQIPTGSSPGLSKWVHISLAADAVGSSLISKSTISY